MQKSTFDTGAEGMLTRLQGHFSDEVRYLPDGLSERVIRGDFRMGTVNESTPGEVGHVLQMPRLHIQRSKLQREPLETDRVCVRGVWYRVAGQEDDEIGSGTWLDLEEVPA